LDLVTVLCFFLFFLLSISKDCKDFGKAFSSSEEEGNEASSSDDDVEQVNGETEDELELLEYPSIRTTFVCDV
tara:strand:+ start:403 stop:621 length:219 start_codon:yes stop_codon:yes gene_type:complete